MNELDIMLQEVIPDAITKKVTIPECGDLKLNLLEPAGMDRNFSFIEAQTIFANTPFWAFCWASGQALARYILHNPQLVAGRRIVDFGSGSGIVAIAAAIAGADEAVACDIDPYALIAAKRNAELNKVNISVSDSINIGGGRYDLLTAADVLYNANNLFLLDNFLNCARGVILSDSRVKDIRHLSYSRIFGCVAATLPVLDKDNADETVSIYEGHSSIF